MARSRAKINSVNYFFLIFTQSLRNSGRKRFRTFPRKRSLQLKIGANKVRILFSYQNKIKCNSDDGKKFHSLVLGNVSQEAWIRFPIKPVPKPWIFNLSLRLDRQTYIWKRESTKALYRLSGCQLTAIVTYDRARLFIQPKIYAIPVTRIAYMPFSVARSCLLWQT